MHYGRPEDLETLIQLALREDIGNGDILPLPYFLVMNIAMDH